MPCILLPFQNLVLTLPTMQLRHWVKSLRQISDFMRLPGATTEVLGWEKWADRTKPTLCLSILTHIAQRITNLKKKKKKIPNSQVWSRTFSASSYNEDPSSFIKGSSRPVLLLSCEDIWPEACSQVGTLRSWGWIKCKGVYTVCKNRWTMAGTLTDDWEVVACTCLRPALPSRAQRWEWG